LPKKLKELKSSGAEIFVGDIENFKDVNESIIVIIQSLYILYIEIKSLYKINM